MPRHKVPAKKHQVQSKGSKASKADKKTAPAEGGVKRRWRAGTVALREIKRYQKQTKVMLPRAPFQRLVRDISKELDQELRFKP